MSFYIGTDKVKSVYVGSNEVKKIYIGTDLVYQKSGGRLPSTYQEVEWIRSSGSQYIDTGIVPSNKTGIDIEFNVENPVSTVFDETAEIFGAFNNTNNRFVCSTWKTYDGGEMFVGSNSYNPHIVPFTDQHIIITPPNTYTVDETDYSMTDNVSNISYSLYLFSRHYITSEGFATMKLYNCKIKENGTLVRDFVPCYRKSDNEIGLYDLVNNTFYTNQGTGTFTKGADVN